MNDLDTMMGMLDRAGVQYEKTSEYPPIVMDSESLTLLVCEEADRGAGGYVSILTFDSDGQLVSTLVGY